ncbi:hypothetical protein [Bacillus sp. S56]|uniref:hypothetical protein n=1 Tax=Bacillus sp. S56 TaxID=1226987 RepID=UPI00190DA366|nr:hypothetical protein [Bacillus sp. S56]MBK0072367.1 hypothetical protein [Bacillus sp. S56]
MMTNEEKLIKELNEILEEYNKTLKELIETKRELEETYGEIIDLHCIQYMMTVRLAELGDPDAIEEMERLDKVEEQLSIKN